MCFMFIYVVLRTKWRFGLEWNGTYLWCRKTWLLDLLLYKKNILCSQTETNVNTYFSTKSSFKETGAWACLINVHFDNIIYLSFLITECDPNSSTNATLCRNMNSIKWRCGKLQFEHLLYVVWLPILSIWSYDESPAVVCILSMDHGMTSIH